jgi:hypothetical protein
MATKNSESANAKGKQPAADEELTDPSYSDDDDEQPVTLEELYDAVAELRGLVMVLADPVMLRQQAKDAARAKREAAADGVHAFPSTPQAYFKMLHIGAAVVAGAPAPARQMVIDAVAATPKAATASKTALDAYRGMSVACKRQMREHYNAQCEALPDPTAVVDAA